MKQLLPFDYQFLDDNGNPVAGGELSTYISGTTTPLNTFADAAGLITLENPIPLNDFSRPSASNIAVTVFGSESQNYTLILKDADGAQLAAADNISGIPGATATDINFSNNHGIKDSNGNNELLFGVATGAVNYLKITNAATGNNPSVAALGADSNIGITLIPKGTGVVGLNGDSAPATLAPVGAAADMNLNLASKGAGLVNIDYTATGNYVAFQHSTTGNNPTFQVAGVDSSRNINIFSKGITGCALIGNAQAYLAFPVGLAPYINGLSLTRTGNTTVTFNIGKCSDSTGNAFVSLNTALTKTLGTTWAAGNSAGGGSSLATNTWYHCFIIMNGSGVVDCGFDTSLTASNLLTASSYTYYRRVGSVLTDGSSNIKTFLQVGNTFIWLSPVQDFTSSSLSTTVAAFTVLAPLGVRCLIQATSTYTKSASNTYGIVFDGDSTVTTYTPSTHGSNFISLNAGDNRGAGMVQAMTNTSSQIKAAADASGTTLALYTQRWTDYRGQS